MDVDTEVAMEDDCTGMASRAALIGQRGPEQATIGAGSHFPTVELLACDCMQASSCCRQQNSKELEDTVSSKRKCATVNSHSRTTKTINSGKG